MSTKPNAWSILRKAFSEPETDEYSRLAFVTYEALKEVEEIEKERKKQKKMKKSDGSIVTVLNEEAGNEEAGASLPCLHGISGATGSTKLVGEENISSQIHSDPGIRVSGQEIAERLSAASTSFQIPRRPVEQSQEERLPRPSDLIAESKSPVQQSAPENPSQSISSSSKIRNPNTTSRVHFPSESAIVKALRQESELLKEQINDLEQVLRVREILLNDQDEYVNFVLKTQKREEKVRLIALDGIGHLCRLVEGQDGMGEFREVVDKLVEKITA